MSQHFGHDVLIIGSGAAGLSLALMLPDNLRIASHLVTMERAARDAATNQE